MLQVLYWTWLIPFGQIITYGDIARWMNKPGASRAVGRALHNNPVPVFIPCHRVVGKDGNLTGFSAGLGLKKQLLRLEGHRIE
ncbi:MGMT family protein [bacterium]|nr:MGMT family protein [bacterium]MBU1065598.1 MGMT family protein [bacterium]MBU1634025.1 MGMT family protein [bacterium]MBU1873452.1 MGMT family protein [bacterium]